MKSRCAILRVVLGVLIAPWVYIVVWSLPVLEHSAFHKWLVINTFMAYSAFMVLAGISHIVLARLKARKMWTYCVIMFGVAALIDLLLSLWSLSGYASFYYAQTQVVEHHEITNAGYFLQIQEALVHGAVSALAMALFWFFAVFSPKVGVQHA